MKLILLFITLLAVAPFAFGGTVESFETKPAFILETNTNAANTVDVVDHPTKKGARVLKIAWPSQNSPYVSVNYSEPGVFITEKSGKYRITAHVNAEKVGSEVKSLAMRILDRYNETFQLSAELTKAGAPGWYDVSWTLDTTHPDTGGVSSWGVEVNNVIDLPVSLLGFAFSFNENSSPGGVLLIGDISVVKLAD